jgi:uncharacterized protein YycO
MRNGNQRFLQIEVQEFEGEETKEYNYPYQYFQNQNTIYDYIKQNSGVANLIVKKKSGAAIDQNRNFQSPDP